MAMSSTASPARPRIEIALLQVLVLIFLALRLYGNLTIDLLGDEAYYWMWGQHLSWSYFDHPPLHAWLLRVVATFFGWHTFNLRLLTWLTLAGTLAIFWLWARRLTPDDPHITFWRTAAIYLSSPMFFGLTMVAYHDHLVVFLVLLAAHCFVVFVERYESGGAKSFRWLYAAALTVGLAALAKYSAVFLALGLGLTFLWRPKLRLLLLTPYPWLAALLALGTQAPVLWWNLVESGASFRYHLNDRWGGNVGSVHWINLLIFVAQTVLLGSPFLVWPIIKSIVRKVDDGFASAAKTVAVTTLCVSTVTLVAISLFMNAYFYWNIPGVAVTMALLAGVMTNAWLRWAHYLYGLFWAVVVVCNFAVVPMGTLLARQDNGSSINYDWSLIADHMRNALAAAPTDLVASTRYSTTSQIGFALGTADAVKLSNEHSQYDYWQDPAQLAGKSAMILVDESDNSSALKYLRDHFDTLTEVDSFTITRFGRYVYAWRIMRGEGYRP